jgi:hypothetical protein
MTAAGADQRHAVLFVFAHPVMAAEAADELSNLPECQTEETRPRLRARCADRGVRSRRVRTW